MISRVIKCIVMVALGLTVVAYVAMAQNGPHIGDGSDPGYTAAQHKLTTEPGYSIGGGSAHVGSPGPNWVTNQHHIQTEHGYSIGTGSAELKDMR